MVARAGHGVADLVQKCAKQWPNAPAVTDPRLGKSITYRQLWHSAGWLATTLADRGIGPGDFVAIGLERSVDLVVAMLGIVRAGAAYLPLDDRAPAERISDILDEARATVAVSDRRPDSRWRDALAGVDVLPVPDSENAAGARIPSGATLSGVAGDDAVYAMYTSGSTGRPKGVVVPHRAVIRLAVGPNFCTIEPGDRVAQVSNPAFDATTFEVWNALVAGGEVVVLPSVADLAVDEWVELVRRERITTLFLTTSLFHTVAREVPDACRSLRNVIVGGEQLELAAVRRVLAAGGPARLVNGYGPTETTTFAAYFDCTGDSLAGLQRIPIGFALQDTSLHVLDAELRPVPSGTVGELCIGGPGVALGYLGQPELTAERFVPEPATGAPMYRTGDVARLLPSGAIELLGRRDRQVKLRGFRIELPEIELAATATGLVDAAFVEKVGDGPAASLVGFVLPAATSGSGPDEIAGTLAARLSRHLPAYMIPSRWLVLPHVPVGATGKVDRAALLALLPAGEVAVQPRDGDLTDPTGAEVQRMWRQVLGVPEARPGDGFLEQGGNSITAAQLAARISRHLTVRVQPADVLLAATLEDLVAHVGGLLPAPRRPQPADAAG